MRAQVKILAFTLLGIALAACACGRSCEVPASPSAVDASDPAAACENLARLGCTIGVNPRCDSVLATAVVENHTTSAAVACAESATSPSAVVACDAHFFSCP
jgi:hypothetical protein